jgi:hypothetical protein
MRFASVSAIRDAHGKRQSSCFRKPPEAVATSPAEVAAAQAAPFTMRRPLPTVARRC